MQQAGGDVTGVFWPVVAGPIKEPRRRRTRGEDWMEIHLVRVRDGVADWGGDRDGDGEAPIFCGSRLILSEVRTASNNSPSGL